MTVLDARNTVQSVRTRIVAPLACPATSVLSVSTTARKVVRTSCVTNNQDFVPLVVWKDISTETLPVRNVLFGVLVAKTRTRVITVELDVGALDARMTAQMTAIAVQDKGNASTVRSLHTYSLLAILPLRIAQIQWRQNLRLQNVHLMCTWSARHL